MSLAYLVLAALTTGIPQEPPWKLLPDVEPEGEITFSGSYVVETENAAWSRPPFVYDERVASFPKRSRVLVVIYNPVLEAHGGKTLIEHLGSERPEAVLARSVRDDSTV